MKMKSFNTDGAFADNYKFLIGAISPRPIAVVSTRNIDGSNNLAPFSFFAPVSAKPMILAFCPMIRTSTVTKKDTVINIEREKEFVVNFAHEALAQKINLASTELPYGEDEFTFSGLTPIDSEKIKAKRILESLVQFECIFRDQISYGEHAGAGRIITGEVIKIHVAEHILDENKINSQLFLPIARGAGNDWFRTTDRFELPRLTVSQIQK